MQQSKQKSPIWFSELVALRYGLLLPTLIHVVQTTIASIDMLKLHSYIQEIDVARLNEADDEGVHTPLCLTHWIWHCGYPCLSQVSHIITESYPY